MQQPPSPTLLPTPAREPVVQPAGVAPPKAPKRKLKKLRLAFVLFGLGLLAIVSTVFGMLMAVSSDLPALENKAEYRAAKNSVLLAADGHHSEVATLTGNKNRILLTSSQISSNIKSAVIAIEDRRFYQHSGVDYKGIARAFGQDLLRKKAAQGGSTITQQFVKNALSAQGNRSVFQKLREAALAYHMERRWSKQKILTEYLNTVYFGNGAYGVESAVRTYFGTEHDADGDGKPDPGGPPTASDVRPEQAALLAGLIASPAAYDPVQHPRAAKERRDLVLRRMYEQQYITRGQYLQSVAVPVPGRGLVHPPLPDSKQPYFSTWLTQQLVDRYRPGLVFGGGLKVRTTLDPELQQSAEQAISRNLTGVGPDASVVAIDNKTGEIRAMVGGANYEQRPFNLATNGHRQPGSSFKPFTLLAALETGVGPDATFTSQPKVFPVPGSRKEKFVVHNFEDNYSGIASLRTATAFSDNSVFAELGLRVGTRKIARLAQNMGLRTRVSTNPAMTLGGLKEGLTPLELAYAYSTIANKGMRVSGSLAPHGEGPVAIEKVEGSGIDDKNEKQAKRVFPASVGETAQQLLAGVIQSGTGRQAQIGEFAAGKTGTTENYGDAWFVGFNKDLTVAVWVGYADRLRPMKTEWRGSPVEGGTYPALIWQDLMTAWIGIRDARDAAKGKRRDDTESQSPPAAPAAPSGPATPQAPAPSGKEDGGKDSTPKGNRGSPSKPSQPQAPAPEQPPPGPQPPAQTPPAGGGGANAPG
jgi:penicillin-binding protein 1A